MKTAVLLIIIVTTRNTDLVKAQDNENQKCSLTQLEENIKKFEELGSRIFFPTLKSLKKLYPGDSFKDTKEKECTDIESDDTCKRAAELGNCNGTNHEVLAIKL